MFGPVGPERISVGDLILISGTIADHGTAILNVRENLGFSKVLESDCAPLWELVAGVSERIGENLHALRDPTRGGLASTLNEFAEDTGLQFVLLEDSLPVRPEVASFANVLGLDVLTIANEGKCLLIVAPEAAETALEALHLNPVGRRAAIIGRVEAGGRRGRLILETTIGTSRIIPMPLETGLPRIC